MIDEDAAAFELLVSALFAIGIEQTSKWIAVEVVNGDLLTGEQVIPLQGTCLLFDDMLHGTRRGLTALLGILTGSAERTMSELGSAGVKLMGSFGCCQYSLTKQPLDTSHSTVSKTIVPTKKFFLKVGQVEVG